jgi:hypothetical protein
VDSTKTELVVKCPDGRVFDGVNMQCAESG